MHERLLATRVQILDPQDPKDPSNLLFRVLRRQGVILITCLNQVRDGSIPILKVSPVALLAAEL